MSRSLQELGENRKGLAKNSARQFIGFRVQEWGSTAHEAERSKLATGEVESSDRARRSCRLGPRRFLKNSSLLPSPLASSFNLQLFSNLNSSNKRTKSSKWSRLVRLPVTKPPLPYREGGSSYRWHHPCSAGDSEGLRAGLSEFPRPPRPTR
jgi:hypothetical protein